MLPVQDVEGIGSVWPGVARASTQLLLPMARNLNLPVQHVQLEEGAPGPYNDKSESWYAPVVYPAAAPAEICLVYATARFSYIQSIQWPVEPGLARHRYLFKCKAHSSLSAYLLPTSDLCCAVAKDGKGGILEPHVANADLVVSHIGKLLSHML